MTILQMHAAGQTGMPVPMNTMAAQQVDGSVAMTSLELVEFINTFRKAQAAQAGQEFPSKGFAELQHKDFLEKVLIVLETSAEFSADLPDSYGRARKGYRFPKREACLMAMSYSYELQAVNRLAEATGCGD
jgi:hypothetical protein